MPDTNVHPVWKFLIAECSRRDMSFADVGHMCGVTRSTAFAWFSRGSQPTLGTVSRLARELGFSLALVKKPDGSGRRVPLE